MKEREKNILKFIIENNGATLDELIKSFDISKRTLYYDIEKINNQIKNCGTIKKITQKYFFIGNYDNLNKIISGVRPVDPYTSYSRQNYILGKIFSGEVITIQKLADELQISKNTCISDMDEIKKSLHLKGLKLQTKPQYDILGDEIIIRELYLIFLQVYEKHAILHIMCIYSVFCSIYMYILCFYRINMRRCFCIVACLSLKSAKLCLMITGDK